MVASFRYGFIEATAATASGVAPLVAGEFDLAILASSWDRRCVCVSEAADLRAQVAVTLSFDVRDDRGLRDRHDQILFDFARCHADEVCPVRGASSDLAGVWGAVWAQIRRVADLKGKPLRIFIDLSACPRYYSLAAVAAPMAEGLARTASLLYAEGYYRRNTSTETYVFTTGQWRLLPVPGLTGLTGNMGKREHLLVSVGFEGDRTLRAVARRDPDRVSVLFPQPGVRKAYERVARQANAELIQQYQVPRSHVIRAPAADALQAWKALADAQLERADAETWYYVCCGTKPHSLALALRALTLGHPTVLYYLPDRHAVTDIRPAGRFWRYDVRDLSAIP